MPQLPAGAPDNATEGFARIYAVVSPDLDDLKTMVYLQASAQVSYAELAKTAPNEGIRRLLEANGRKELVQASRVAEVVKLLCGEDFGVPAVADNPYAQAAAAGKADRAMIEVLVEAETTGAALYETWANHAVNSKAAELLRRNAEDEAGNRERARQALALLD